jgi:hypothetical protein
MHPKNQFLKRVPKTEMFTDGFENVKNMQQNNQYLNWTEISKFILSHCFIVLFNPYIQSSDGFEQRSQTIAILKNCF